MLKFLEGKLFLFRSCFSRKATFYWFLLVILALMIRYDTLGVTSFTRALSLDGIGQSCYCVLDRYFLTVPAFHELLQLNGSSVHKLYLITRAKNNCVAYDFPPTSGKSQKGRPRKKGDAIKIFSLFSTCSEEFKKAQVTMYEETQNDVVS